MKKIWMALAILGAFVSAQADYHNLDVAFGEDGVSVVPSADANIDRYMVGLEATTPEAPYDKIVTMELAFDLLDNYNDNLMITRLEQNGSIDTTFGHDGSIMLTTESTESLASHDLAIQSDEKIVVSSVVMLHDINTSRAMVRRYDTDGSLDTSFGDNGVATTDLNASYAFVETAIQLDGKILSAGYFYNDLTGGMFGVVRYTADGLIDTTFGDGGFFAITDPAIQYVYGLTIQPDGSILTSVDYYEVLDEYTSVFTSKLVKVTSTGLLDTTYGGGDGMVEFAPEQYVGEFVTDAAGKTTVLSSYWDDLNGREVYTLTRFDSNGALDTSYGNNGTVVCDFIGDGSPYITNMNVQADGKIIMQGSDYFSSYVVSNIYRINTDGTLDQTFGLGDGIGGIISISEENLPFWLGYLVIQGDGKIVLGGSTYNEELMINDGLGVMRFNPETLNDLTAAPWEPKASSLGSLPAIINYLLD